MATNRSAPALAALLAAVLTVPAAPAAAQEQPEVAAGGQAATPVSDLRVVREAGLLARGDRGAPVAALQRLLNSVQDADLQVDGVFGRLTQRAVREVQRSYGVAADGIVGPVTTRVVEDALDLRLPARGSGPASGEASPGAALAVSDVRTGAHAGYDRVVFDLAGPGRPGWQVEYVQDPRQQGSGRAVPIEGDAYLRVQIRGVAAPPATDAPYYDGPDVVTPERTSNLQQLHMGTWFEGIYDATLALDSEQPFDVFTLDDPRRLVIDIRTADRQPPPDGVTPTDVAAVVDASGRAVALDTRTGVVQRVLARGVRVDDPSSNGVAVSPDGSTAYVVLPAAPGGQSQIAVIGMDGGPPELTIPGRSPAVSPDGSTLAYVRVEETDGLGQLEPTIRLRDLERGTERVLRVGDQPFYGIWELAWLPDGQRLAFTAGEARTGVHVVDRGADSLDAARRLGPEAQDASWSDVAVLGPDRLAVVDRCCGQPDADRWRVVEVDARTGAVGAEVLGRQRVEATSVDGRPGADGLLVVESGGPDGGPLLRWDDSGGLRQIGHGVVAADW